MNGKPQVIDNAALEETRRTGVSSAILDTACWAAGEFEALDSLQTLSIAQAVADFAFDKAHFYAEWAVRETGFGVVEHKAKKNRLASRGMFEHYKDHFLVGARLNSETNLFEIARPAGVVFALAPSTNPVATVFFKIIFALLTRNAIVISPHPAARECSVHAARALHDVAVAAGAPDGCIQVIEHPKIPLVEALMSDERVSVILATGGTAMVRSAYSSSNPAIGVGPGNAPILIDATAELDLAAQALCDSKSFDNSVLCTNESVVIVDERVRNGFIQSLHAHGGYVLTDSERDRLRGFLFPEGRLNPRAIGKSASWIANEAAISVPKATRLLVAPISKVLPDEHLVHEKLCPVVALASAQDALHGIQLAKLVLGVSGAGHTSGIHSNDPATVVAFAAAAKTYRVVVNSGTSAGAAGFDTNLPPTFTIGTGFLGRSSMGENLQPHHLVQFTRVTYSRESSKQIEALAKVDIKKPADALSRSTQLQTPLPAPPSRDPSIEQLRAEIKDMVLSELRTLLQSKGTNNG